MAKTLGHYLLDDAIPNGYRPEGVYSKKQLQKNMVRLAKDDPSKYVETITKVKNLGDQYATMMGISVGLDDIAPLYEKRDAIVKPALAQIKKAKTKAERQKIILDTQDKLINYALTHPGTMGEMARSGARGSPLQLMRAVGAPAASSDERDNVQGWLTTHSYSEGLRPSEWWANNREARMNAAKSTIEVTQPGDLSKILVNNTSDQVVTINDCHTRNGLNLPVDDSSAIDRYLARPANGFTAGTLINARVLGQLKKEKINHIVVRSPMSCEADQGICQKCMGLNTVGRLNGLGENVGIRASQSLGEPLTQLALNAKHGVRVSGTNPLDVSGLEGFRMIIESPASFKNKATLAPEDGRITSITKAPQGGYYVTINTTKTYVMQGLQPLVKVGDRVHAGDAISQGVPKPDEVVKYKGLGAGRDYIVNKLNSIYKDSGVHVDRRHFEVLAKSTLNSVRIEDIDDDSSQATGLVRGDIIDYNKLRNISKSRAEATPIAQAEGKYLAESALHHLVGTRITQPMVQELKRAGYTEVHTAIKTPMVSPIMQPATRNPLLNPDWLVRLGHRYLKQSILEGAHKGQHTNIHSTSPIPGLVFSAEFGEGQSGRY